MNNPTVRLSLLLLLSSSKSAGLCELAWSCSSVNQNFVLGQLDNITSVSQCRQGCANTTDCEFFTFYNASVTPGGGWGLSF